MKEASAHIEPVHDGFTTKETIFYTLFGIVIVGGAFFVGRSLLRNAIANSAEKKTFDDGTPETYAKQIKMAFENDGWWGTDLEALRRVIKAIPSKTILKQVINAYQNLYHRSMGADLQSELKSSEYNEMLAIIAGKPEKGKVVVAPQLTIIQYKAWADRLKAAFDKTYGPFPGTDEDAIRSVFLEIPTQAAFQQVAVAYKNEFGNDLISDLKSEFRLWGFDDMYGIILKKPKG